MATVKVQGLVIKQTPFGESNRILTIFTKEYGIIKACVYGAKSVRSKIGAAAQFLCYGNYILNKTGKELMTVLSCEATESFFSIQEDIVKLSLCVYMCDLVYTLINTDSPDENILSLLLNSVYALSKKNIPTETVRAVFELKAMAYAGYMPNISCCGCGDVHSICAFSAKNGGIVCTHCMQNGDISINSGVYHALAYILNSEPKKMFSFNATPEIMKTISKIAESYVTEYTEKKLSSLDYYKKISSVDSLKSGNCNG